MPRAFTILFYFTLLYVTSFGPLQRIYLPPVYVLIPCASLLQIAVLYSGSRVGREVGSAVDTVFILL